MNFCRCLLFAAGIAATVAGIIAIIYLPIYVINIWLGWPDWTAWAWMVLIMVVGITAILYKETR